MLIDLYIGSGEELFIDNFSIIDDTGEIYHPKLYTGIFRKSFQGTLGRGPFYGYVVFDNMKKITKYPSFTFSIDKIEVINRFSSWYSTYTSASFTFSEFNPIKTSIIIRNNDFLNLLSFIINIISIIK